MSDNWTVIRLLNTTEEYLASKSVDTAKLDAERMLATVLGMNRLDLYLEPDRIVSDEERDRLRTIVKRRAAREPAQYILGTTEFYGLEFKVDRRALIPRRETEQLVDRSREIVGSRAGRVLELGTGCGCIAAALAKELPEGSRILATDVSEDALSIARENAHSLGLADRIVFASGDLFDALDGASEREFEVIVGNLPYVESGTIPWLTPEVRDNEPHVALDGGADGLGLIRRAASAAPEFLAPGGWILFEIGFGQADRMVDILRDAGLEPGPVLSDASGIERVAQAQKTR